MIFAILGPCARGSKGIGREFWNLVPGKGNRLLPAGHSVNRGFVSIYVRIYTQGSTAPKFTSEYAAFSYVAEDDNSFIFFI